MVSSFHAVMYGNLSGMLVELHVDSRVSTDKTLSDCWPLVMWPNNDGSVYI